MPRALLTRYVSDFLDAAADASTLGEPVTDKVLAHGYEGMYARHLLPAYEAAQAAGKRFKLLEIGMGCNMAKGTPGASTMLWSRLLPSAERWQAELDGECARALGAKLPVRARARGAHACARPNRDRWRSGVR